MAMIKCADCGHDISSNADHCLYCGSKAFDAAKIKNEKEQEAAEIKGAKTGVLIGSGIALLVLLVFVVGLGAWSIVLPLLFFGVVGAALAAKLGGFIAKARVASKQAVE